MKGTVYNKFNSKILVHVIAWAIIFILPYLFTSEYYEHHGRDNDATSFIYLDTVTKVFWMALFYLNAFVIIPKLLYDRKYFFFAMIQLLLFAAIIGFHGYLFGLLVEGRTFNFFRSSFHNLVPFLFAVIASISYKTITDKNTDDILSNEKQKENLKTELSFLRSQISPHFLFNVLNNMVAMVRLNSNDLEPTIIKLSSLMQYMLYETDEEKVLLKSEVEYLQSYIDLQKQRVGDKLQLQLLIDVKEDWHSIEPMLLIPFVENAFKHGIGLIQDPIIDIMLKADQNELLFTVKNKYHKADTSKDKSSGIGLANVKRRLELLYGKNHELLINQSTDWYIAELKIKLKP